VARAQSKTVSYDVTSPTSGDQRLVFERSYVKSVRVGNRYVTATKQYALFDKQGRRYERESDSVMVCIATGERYYVIGQADRIRKP
jgi:hypothetical protein